VNFSRFWAVTHILKVNCAETTGVRPKQPGTKFPTLNVDFSSPSTDTLGFRRAAHAGVKEGYPPKSGQFFAVGSSERENVADKHSCAAYCNKHGDELYSSVYIDDLERP